MTTTRHAPLICLAASGGGHVRQILDLAPFWSDYPHYVVTEDTALGRSIATSEPVEFVPHFSLGQARLGHPVRMIWAALTGIVRSWRIIATRPPDLFITTGAGSQVFVMLFARLRGAKVVMIDSFARFDAPSAFARLAGRLAHVRIAQSAASAAKWPGALVFDPFRTLSGARPEKQPLMFATVGATLAFPRLVDLVAHARAAGLVPEELIVQHGIGGQAIAGARSVEELPFDEVQSILRRADIVVCHGGTGSLITALREHCRVIAIPREFERAEHYDNHQSEIVTAFEARGLIASAHDDASFAAALARVRASEPRAATTDPSDLIAYLRTLAETLSQRAQ